MIYVLINEELREMLLLLILFLFFLWGILSLMWSLCILGMNLNYKVYFLAGVGNLNRHY